MEVDDDNTDNKEENALTTTSDVCPKIEPEDESKIDEYVNSPVDKNSNNEINKDVSDSDTCKPSESVNTDSNHVDADIVKIPEESVTVDTRTSSDTDDNKIAATVTEDSISEDKIIENGAETDSTDVKLEDESDEEEFKGFEESELTAPDMSTYKEFVEMMMKSPDSNNVSMEGLSVRLIDPSNVEETMMLVADDAPKIQTADLDSNNKNMEEASTSIKPLKEDVDAEAKAEESEKPKEVSGSDSGDVHPADADKTLETELSDGVSSIDFTLKMETESERTDCSSPVSSPSVAPKKRGSTKKSVNLNSPLYLRPFELGWKRELVYRNSNEDSLKRNADIYYYTPKGKKLRSLREISENLKGSDLCVDNFSFFKEPIGLDSEKEIIRDAKPNKGPPPKDSSPLLSGLSKKIMKMSPTPNNATPVTRVTPVTSSPAVSSTVETPKAASKSVAVLKEAAPTKSPVVNNKSPRGFPRIKVKFSRMKR